MTAAFALDLGLAMLLVILAVGVVAVRDTFAAITAFIAFGLTLTLLWVRLHAPDVAMAEAAIGGGLTGVLLIRAAGRLRARAPATTAAAAAPVKTIAAIVCAAVAVLVAWAVLSLPEPAPTLAPQAAAGTAAVGLGNPITAVLVDFRAIDTLLETIVVVFALIGVWSLAPDRAWGGRPGWATSPAADKSMVFAARVLTPLGVVVALYVLWVGADLPGGKFQAATVLAAMALLLWISGVADAPAVGNRGLRCWLVAGPLVFVAIGFAGAVTAGVFLGYPEGLAKMLIKAIELALTPSLALLLMLLVAGAPARPARRR